MQEDKKMLMVIGGATFNGSILNSLTSLFKTIYNIGQDVGGAIRRMASGKVCKL